ncbi:MAG: flagellar hook-length control protein FliK [Chloroflexi bacterium]|nr:flagellar hook-length control protein FliK [Chloroflexota bacterium]
MNIQGPLPVLPTQQRVDDSSLALRVNQRIAGEILHVNGEQVNLSLQGVQVVARMANPDQLASLANRRYAQFVIRDIQGQTLVLQLVEPGKSFQTAPPVGNDLSTAILASMHLPADTENMLLVRLVIGQRLALNPQTLQELRQALDGLGAWGESEARMAVALKQAGLPLDPATIQLAMHSGQNSIQELPQLLVQLYNLSTDAGLPPSVQEMARQAVNGLVSGILRPGSDPAALGSNFQQAVQTLGQSLENALVQILSQGESADTPVPLALARLQSWLSHNGRQPLAQSIDHFMQGARLAHFSNTPPESPTPRGDWLHLDVPIQFPRNPDQSQPETQPLHFKVARRSGAPEDQPVDPAYTNLVLQVDIQPGETLQVDLSIVAQHIKADVTASTRSLAELAQAGFPDLRAGLSALGYQVVNSHISVGQPDTSGRLEPRPALQAPLHSIDVGI